MDKFGRAATQLYLPELAQETLSNTLHTKNPHMVRRPSGEVPVAPSSILSQRQVTKAPPPLTPDSFEGNSDQPGAIPDDQLRTGYNHVRKLVAP